MNALVTLRQMLPTRLLMFSLWMLLAVRSSILHAQGDGRRAALALVATLPIGDMDTTHIKRLGWIAPRANGDVVVLDRDGERLLHYGARGEFLGRFAGTDRSLRVSRTGLRGGAFADENTLVVWDPSAQRVFRINALTQRVDTVKVPMRGYQVGSQNEVASWANGVFGVRISVGAPPNARYWLRFTPDGQVLDSLRQPDELHPRRFSTMNGERSAFSSAPVSGVDPQGTLLVGFPTDARLLISSPEHTERTLRVVYPPVPVLPDERAEWQRVLAADGNSQSTPLPANKPVFRALFGDGTGRVWIERYVPSQRDAKANLSYARHRFEWHEPTYYDVRDRSGTLLFALALPPRSTLLAVSGDRVWLLEYRDDGRSAIGVYEIR